MEYMVEIAKAKTKELTFARWRDPSVPSPEYYRAGYHTFSSLNDARADAIRLYRKGWHSGISERATKIISKTTGAPVQGVGIRRRKGNYPGTDIGYIVRIRGKMRWVENKADGGVYLVNDDGSLVPKKQNDWHPFGL